MEALNNLVKINQLKLEPFDTNEFVGMLRAGDNKLKETLNKTNQTSQSMRI